MFWMNLDVILIQTRKNKNKYILFQIRDTQLDQNNFKAVRFQKLVKSQEKKSNK